MMKRLAIIPARSGSKRIPGKNIRSFFNKPIISYSIKTALHSKLFDEVMVSTEDDEIATVAKRYGAKVPFLRNLKTSGDMATTFSVIEEVVCEYKKAGIKIDECACIYPCAPLLEPSLLKKSVSTLHKKNADVVFPVVECSQSVQRSMSVKGGRLLFNDEAFSQQRSQDIPNNYFDSGQFYTFKIKPVLAAGSLMTNNTVPMIVDEMSVQNIDTENDWLLAEWKYSVKKQVA